MKKKMDMDIEIDDFEIDTDIDLSKEIKKNLSLVKCDKCATSNVKGSNLCIKCNAKLKKDIKTCPKCAKINFINNVRCESCGYKFGKKNNLVKSFLISLMVVIVLLGATYIKGEALEYELGIKIICGALLVAIVLSTLNHNSKDQIELSTDDKVQKKFRRMEFFGKLFILGGIGIAAFVVYWLFIR